MKYGKRNLSELMEDIMKVIHLICVGYRFYYSLLLD